MSPGSTTLAVGSVAPTDRLDTLPGWPWDPFDRTAPRTLGWAAAEWAERWLVQPNGPRAGKPFRFTSGQLRFLLWWFALDDQAQWLFAHGVRRLAKGSGKSPFAAVLALIEFCGPCRLARFDDREPGGCRARAMHMPLVQIAATAESQTANTMRMVRAFAPKGSKLVAGFGLDPGKTRYYRLPEGTLEVITSSVTASEGAEASFVVADETEHWKPSNAGPELSSTLLDNLAKSGSRMIETCNAWIPGQETVAEGSWDAWLAQEEGRLVEDAGRILYDARLAPPDTDMADPDSLRSALEWIYGDCDWKRPAEGEAVDVQAIMARIWSPKATPSESKRKYLNWPSVAEDAWITPQAWSALTDPGRVIDPIEEIVVFFDGSKSRDATALVACCVADGHVFVPHMADGRPMIWEPGPDEEVPAFEVDAAVDQLFDTYDVAGFFGDVREWESFVKVSWPERHADRLRVLAVPTGKDPHPIAWDMRGRVFEFTAATELALSEIGDGLFTHDGNPILARHVANARRRPNRYGVSIGKESPASARKIDAAVCMIGARLVRRLVLAAGPKRKRTGRVW